MSLPYRTVALPPVDGTVCDPAPPPPQPWTGVVRGVPAGEGSDPGAREGEREALAVAAAGVETCGPEAEGDGEALAEAEGEPETEAEGEGLGEGNMVGADRATGGFGRVEPATKSTVAMTAVTLAAVQDTHMSR
ncbi:hypothetical protein ACGFX2_17755 [Streptomyces goshikiensis]|uniref:hypothetical protein n=1 Tax=Streptomyces goshikiensis TaxID=1942 RepID=UPI003713C4C7